MQTQDSDWQICRLRRTPDEIAALRDICETWSQDKLFWSFDEVLEVLMQPGCELYYVFPQQATNGAKKHWTGVLIAKVGPFSSDILYIYVRQDERRKKLAQKLLTYFFEDMRRKPQIKDVMLEVRPSNKNAINLYQKMNLSEVGRRTRYYADGEDAIVLKYEIERTSSVETSL